MGVVEIDESEAAIRSAEGQGITVVRMIRPGKAIGCKLESV